MTQPTNPTDKVRAEFEAFANSIEGQLHLVSLNLQKDSNGDYKAIWASRHFATWQAASALARIAALNDAATLVEGLIERGHKETHFAGFIRELRDGK